MKHDENGLVFHTPQQLCEQIIQLLTGFPHNCTTLQTFRDNLRKFQENRWHDNWSNVVLPLVASGVKEEVLAEDDEE